MGITSGFYNSINGDREYSSDDLSSMFDEIITDGVFENIGLKFRPMLTSGMSISIGAGKAWINSKWIENNNEYALTFAISEIVTTRIDAVVIESNRTDRLGSIKMVKGVPSTNGTKPTMINTEDIKQLPIAFVTIRAGVTTLLETDIEPVVGTTQCPYITSIIPTTDINQQTVQWNEAWKEWFDTTVYDNESSYMTSIQAITNRLSNIQAVQLQNQIGSLASLKTTDKTTLVNAVNELVTNVTSLNPLVAGLDVNVYISTTGSDTTGTGAQATPYRTMNKAISTIPKNLNGNKVYFRPSPGVYAETPLFNGFYNGSIRLMINGNTTFTGLHIVFVSDMMLVGNPTGSNTHELLTLADATNLTNKDLLYIDSSTVDLFTSAYVLVSNKSAVNPEPHIRIVKSVFRIPESVIGGILYDNRFTNQYVLFEDSTIAVKKNEISSIFIAPTGYANTYQLAVSYVKSINSKLSYRFWTVSAILDDLSIIYSDYSKDYTKPIVPALLNSWIVYGGTYNIPAYYKDAQEIVYLQGMIKGGTPGSGSVAFVLPAEYRPAGDLNFPILSNNVIGRVTIKVNGQVIIYIGSTVWASLDGIAFRNNIK